VARVTKRLGDRVADVMSQSTLKRRLDNVKLNVNPRSRRFLGSSSLRDFFRNQFELAYSQSRTELGVQLRAIKSIGVS